MFNFTMLYEIISYLKLLPKRSCFFSNGFAYTCMIFYLKIYKSDTLCIFQTKLDRHSIILLGKIWKNVRSVFIDRIKLQRKMKQVPLDWHSPWDFQLELKMMYWTRVNHSWINTPQANTVWILRVESPFPLRKIEDLSVPSFGNAIPL